MCHPALLGRSCDDCIQWMYDETTGRRMTRLGKPIPRGAGPTPCETCPKCPAGEPATPATGRTSELSEKNWRALEHFIATRHDGLTEVEKADPIVRKHRKILENLLMHHENRLLGSPKLIPLLPSAGGAGGSRVQERMAAMRRGGHA